MKKSLSLVIAMLLFVVLGCSLGKMFNKKDDAPTPVTDKPTTSSSPTDTTTTSNSGGKANLSMDSFNKIRLGMSYDEVKGIIGSDGNETASSKVGNNTSKSYKWQGEKFARVSVRFRNGKLVYRSQSGLTTGEGSADINQAKFNKINTGMSYAEVKGVIGSDGEMTSESEIFNTKLASYRWKGKKFSNIRASFKNDKLTNKYQSGLK